jgi:uncharacterized OB-fold protein
MNASEPQRPLPNIQGEAREFWEGCARHELLLQHCRACGRVQFYPRTLCKECWSTDLEWVPSDGLGSVYSFTVVHRPPSPAFESIVPYVVALIELDEGVRMLSHVVGTPPDDVQIGQRVRVAFDDLTEEVSLPVFEVA